MSYFEPKFEDCYSCECCDMLNICAVEDSKVQLDLGIWDEKMQHRSFWGKIVGLFRGAESRESGLARIFCVFRFTESRAVHPACGAGQAVPVLIGLTIILLAITSVGCIESPLLSDKITLPAASKVHITVVSTGLGAAYPLADKWMTRDAEFGAVTITGGGSDDHIWTEKAVPPAVVQEYADWIISCAKQVNGIYSVVVEVDDEIIASWSAN